MRIGFMISKVLTCRTFLLILALSIVFPAFAQDVPLPEEEKIYTLVLIEDADPNNLPENAVTKYEFNKETGKLEPQYYELKLTKTEFGTGGGVEYFKWQKDTNGNQTLVSADKESAQITAQYDNSKTNQRITNTTDLSVIDKGSFISQGGSDVTSGGAIYIDSKDANIDSINADFVGNNVYSDDDRIQASGGAIYNSQGIIDKVTGNFIGNYTLNSYISASQGGAIYNDKGTINNISGSFISNYTYGFYISSGGAIYNAGTGTIGNITSDFIGNYSIGNTSVGGGAIYNFGTISNITSNFIGNYTSSTKESVNVSSANGGAISNRGEINTISGNFIGNYAASAYDRPVFGYDSSGGAIYNSAGNIKNISGVFINNYASSLGSYGLGGAISNDDKGTIDEIKADFIGNHTITTSDTYGGAYGGAIYNNKSTINSIAGDFIGNYAYGHSEALGGAVYNSEGTIGNIKGNFIRNYAFAYKGSAQGGAIYYSVHAPELNIEGNFLENYAIGATASAQGGALYISYLKNYGNINGNFIGNYVSGYTGASGGALYHLGNANSYKYSKMGNINANFIRNHATSATGSAYGGALYNRYGTIGNLDESGNLIGGIYGSFIDNYVETNSNDNLALGGAVYTTQDLNFIADNQINYFSGNYSQDYRGKINNAIFVDTNNPTLTSPITIKLQAQNNGKIVFNDQIDGGKRQQNASTGQYEIDRTNSYNLALTGDESGEIYLNNSVINAKVTSEEVKLNLGKKDVFENSDFKITSGTLGFVNGIAEQQIMQSANITGNINLALDVDLATEQIDTLPDNTKVDPNAQLNVNYLNILNDANQNETKIPFAPESYANQVQYTGQSPIAYSPIWKYDVDYLKETGEFLFTRGSTGTYTDYNPAVTAPSVATQAGAYTTQLQTFNYAFQHSDNFMLLPSFDRLTIKNQSKYALAPNNGVYSPLMTPADSASFWVKPYASFENIPLKNGPKVSNINYGTLIGYDSAMKSVKYGFDRVLTGYVGYNGSSQRFQGVDAYQNGGLIGTTATFYKNNFFNATTLSVGASAGDSTTMYGSENYAMLMAGIGNKTGYNFEFKDGKYILQPAMLLSYSFINTFDYRNAAGLKIESDPLHAIQLSPGLKLIMNAKNGWQPYLAIDMTWNILDKSRVTANDVRLPEMSIKPYVSYGAGVQRRFKDDKYTAFGQTMVHSGGRNGVSLTFGLRWRVGKE